MPVPDERIEKLVSERAQARSRKDWAESDRLRGEIEALGYTVKDTKQGQQITKNS